MTRKTPKKKTRPAVDGYGRTPLHYAASEGDAAKVAQLIREGVDPNAQDDNGWTALHLAAQANCLTSAEALLSAGAQVDLQDANGNTPLWRAVFGSRGDGAMIRLLRNAGAVPSVANLHGVSPVSLARTIANYDVARFFADLPDP